MAEWQWKDVLKEGMNTHSNDKMITEKGKKK
jgi:hypothetical protein